MHHVTIYHSDTAAVFSLNDQGLKTYVAKLKKANMLEPLKNIYIWIIGEMETTRMTNCVKPNTQQFHLQQWPATDANRKK